MEVIMEKAKVYYCDMHTGRMNLPEKLKFLMKKAKQVLKKLTLKTNTLLSKYISENPVI